MHYMAVFHVQAAFFCRRKREEYRQMAYNCRRFLQNKGIKNEHCAIPPRFIEIIRRIADG